jgi:hypothetical protein
MHMRRAIMLDLQTQLKTLAGFSGVWIQRIGPIRNAFPAITLYADAESVETLLIHGSPRPQDRVLTVSVNAWIRGTVADERAEEEMDKAAQLIESKLRKPTIADDMVLVATDFTVSEDEPEVHVCSLSYHLSYNQLEYTE